MPLSVFVMYKFVVLRFNEREVQSDQSFATLMFHFHPRDKCHIRLSSVQRKILDEWTRPNEALPPPQLEENSKGPLFHPLEDSADTIDLVQDAAEDCSFVASLCACVARVSQGYQSVGGSSRGFNHLRLCSLVL